MKAVLFFNIIFILCLTTGCEVLLPEGSIELEDIFEAIDAAALAMKQQDAKKLPAVFDIEYAKNMSNYDNPASYAPQNRVTNNYGSKLDLGGV